ncbi:MAG: O-antigen ligase family protein [Ruminococcaceae bacterium]|nr:O-antigen ligase family protein [Oscillospiraceae bacterium]
MQKCTAERVTDVYLITMLLVFPLFFGFSGYGAVTFSKFVFLLSATGLWLPALAALAIAHRLPKVARAPLWPVIAAGAGIALLSWLLCDDPGRSFLGAGRYDGLLTELVYALIFAGVAAFSRPKLLHLRALALSVSLCLSLALWQLGGGNPLGLYPHGWTFFDHGVHYSGVYLGTIGNTNILDAVLCLALPVFAGVYVVLGRREFLLPPALAVPVLLKAGGDGAYLALLCAIVAGALLLLSTMERVRRALRFAAVLCAAAALSRAWKPGPGTPLHFAFLPSVGCLVLAAAVCAGLSVLPLPPEFRPTPRMLRRAFAILAGICALCGLIYVLSYTGSSGTVYELNRLLHGQAEDSFGSSRIRIWRACWALVRRRPLLGWGPGMLAAQLDVQFTRFVPETGRTLSSYADNAHNVYLAALVNTGFLGLAALLARLFAAGQRIARRLSHPMVAAIVPGLLCECVHALFGLGLCLSQPLFWLVLGLACAQERPEE